MLEVRPARWRRGRRRNVSRSERGGLRARPRYASVEDEFRRRWWVRVQVQADMAHKEEEEEVVKEEGLY